MSQHTDAKGLSSALLQMKHELPVSLKFENRYDLLENLSFGRMSFKGFNPEVEKLMKYYEDLKSGKVPDEVDFDSGHDITDYELATSVYMDERSLIDEINERPTKRKRRDDVNRSEPGIQKGNNCDLIYA
ncbi:M-phase phosphoprotein 6 [Dirofilaria immitis]|nr:M-phase phosphoprotein 6 [Dirofilaria immitis]